MARGVQVSKMGKRKRSTKWGTTVTKRRKPQYNPMRGISVRTADFGFPDTFSTKVKYADVFTLTGGVGAIGNQVFTVNSLFDPDLSGIGHQPMWFDQICGPQGTAPYGRYRVKGAKVKVTFATVSPPSISVTNVTPVLVGTMASRSSTLTASTSSQLLESNNTTLKILGDKGSGASTQVVYNSFNPKIDLGIDAEDEALSASYNASPFLGWFVHLFKLDDTGGGQVKAYVEIVFDCVFFSRNEVAQS